MQKYTEISLRDLILLLIKGWKLIVATTAIVMAIAIGVFFSMNTTSYTASTQVTLTFRPDYTSKFGQYTLPQSKAEDFISLLKDDSFINSLSTKSKLDSNRLKTVLTYTPIDTANFTINVSGSTSEENILILRAVEALSEDYINYVVSKRMFTTFDSSFKTRLVGLEKSKTDKQRMFRYFETELNTTTPLLNSNVINPVFSSLSAHLVQVKATLAEIDFSMVETNEQLNEIEITLDSMKSFENFRIANIDFDSPKIGFYFYDINQNEIQRFNAKTLFPISLILGIMLGIFIVFFKNYWTNSSL